jgi:hypothetical protein
MAFKRKLQSDEPSELERVGSSWLQAGLFLGALGAILTAATWWRAGWRTAAIPFLIFLAAAIFALVFWRQLLAGKIDPEASNRHHDRSRSAEFIRRTLWIIAFLSFLIWGLNGGWTLAWVILLAAGLIEWLLDRMDVRRRSK